MGKRRAAEKIRDANAAGVALLMTDADKAVAFLDAASTSSAEDRLRPMQDARATYDSILHSLPRFTLTGAQLISLEERMSTIRKRLVDAGVLKLLTRPVKGATSHPRRAGVSAS